MDKEEKKNELEQTNEEELLDDFGKIAYTLDKTYLSKLKVDYDVIPFDNSYNFEGKIDYVSNIRALKVKRLVYDKDEKIGDCLKNVLSLFANSDNTLALVINRSYIDTEIYFVLKNEGYGRNEDSKNNIDLLAESLKGNFQGSKIEVIEENNGGEDTRRLFQNINTYSISSLSNLPSSKSEDYISQGIDKLLNGVVPSCEEDSYTIVAIAESLTLIRIREMLSGYQEMATSITPFSGYQIQIGKNKSKAKGETKNLSYTKGTSNSISKSFSINSGSFIGVSIGPVMTGKSRGFGYNWGKIKTDNESKTESLSTNLSISEGASESKTYNYKSYMVSDLIARLEKIMKRIEESQSTGLWRYSTYVLSSNSKLSINVANFMSSILQGDQSFLEPSVIQEWSHEESNENTVHGEILKYIRHFTHPIFKNKYDDTLVRATSNIATKELSYSISFPRHSLQGIPVAKGVRFGREPHSLLKINSDIDLGCTYHMYNEEKNNRISLDINELTKHTFITGSTGSGKSNTIYKLIDELEEKEVKFLVIEPTKGEYKNIFGHRDDVNVYGTNYNISQILRINPFKFNNSIHVLEHIDRLIEIFNVCWPMYAAMPAILKDSVERAYVNAGWDLKKSKNKYDSRLFPNFSDVLEQIKIVLEESDYSADNKGDYIGALVTRLKSLTNGINGMIFTQNDLSDEVLFDRNVIVDLSRIGSSETKSLIMGLLVMKLQEYRMAKDLQNSELVHVTVLEEAHKLLKRTSTAQNTETSNLIGKSVEMLSNAIAEMRTYGEGFIISDQSPGLLDMSVIRNTNTKIILRLPDQTDRELVGRASGLNDEQIEELAKLQCGVAAISQSDWLEAVLCKIDKYNFINKKYLNPMKDIYLENFGKQYLLKIIMEREIYRKKDRLDNIKIKNSIIMADIETDLKCKFHEYFFGDDNNSLSKLQYLVHEFFQAENAVQKSEEKDELNEWIDSVINNLSPSIKRYTNKQINNLMTLIINEQSNRENAYNDLKLKFIETKKKGDIVYV